MSDRYRLLTPFYPFLSRLVYGKRLITIQRHLITQLPQTGDLILFGGGNGTILPYIFNHAPELNIEYVEASASMLRDAKENAHQGQKIEFTLNSEFEPRSTRASVIFFPFVLDLYPEPEIERLIHQIERRYGDQLLWLISDFTLNDVQLPLLRRIQIRTTILFFNYTTNHTLHYLPDVFGVFERMRFKLLYSSELGGNFIKGTAFKRTAYDME